MTELTLWVKRNGSSSLDVCSSPMPTSQGALLGIERFGNPRYKCLILNAGILKVWNPYLYSED